MKTLRIGLNHLLIVLVIILSGLTAQAAKLPVGKIVDVASFQRIPRTGICSEMIPVKGILYGTTSEIPFENESCVFSFNPQNDTLKNVVDIDDSICKMAGSCLAYASGLLYGTAYNDYGTFSDIYSVSLSTGHANRVAVSNYMLGFAPADGLVNVKGILYGAGGAYGPHPSGGIYTVDPASGGWYYVADFIGKGVFQPTSLLTDLDGILYGTASWFGGNDTGIVYSVNPQTRMIHILMKFNRKIGADPEGGLTVYHGLLYGTTTAGGPKLASAASGCGEIYSLNPKTGAFRIEATFNGWDGAFPHARLLNFHGLLYGTTEEGGKYFGHPSYYRASGYGEVYAFNPKTRAIQIVASFNGKNGTAPESGLVAHKGRLYGSAELNPASPYSVIYQVNPAIVR